MLPNPVGVFIKRAFVFACLVSYAAAGQKIDQQIPIVISENQIYVQVQVNGHGPYNFMLDSDVSGPGRIDKRLAKELGLNIVGFEENSDGPHRERGFLIGVAKLSVGQITQSNLKLRVADYNVAPKQLPIDGILGRDFFYSYLLTIDGPGRRLIVSRANLDAQARGVLQYTNAFRVLGKVGLSSLTFNLDTGSALSLLFPTASLAGLEYTNTPNQRVVTPATPPFVLQEAVVHDELVLGDVRVKGQKLYYSDKAHQINVGVAFLKDHIVSFDQQKKLIKIE
ncbi:retropepsin-like aspartic protease [Spirosoma areae]